MYEKDLSIVRGTSYSFAVTPSGIASTQLTSGLVGVMGIKKNKTDNTCLIVKRSNYDTTSGTITFSFVPTDTSSLDVGIYYYDIGIKLPDDSTNYYNVVKESRFNILQNITTLSDATATT